MERRHSVSCKDGPELESVTPVDDGERYCRAGSCTFSPWQVGARYKGFNGCLDCIDHPVSGLKVVVGYEFPTSGKVNFGFRMQILAGHACSARRAALLARSLAKTSSPGIGFTLPLSRSS